MVGLLCVCSMGSVVLVVEGDLAGFGRLRSRRGGRDDSRKIHPLCIKPGQRQHTLHVTFEVKSDEQSDATRRYVLL